MTEDQDTRAGDEDQKDESQDEKDPQALAAEAHEDEVSDEMKKMEEDPPEKLEDWPDKGPAMYETFGGPEGHHSYDQGPEQQLGPAEVRHQEGGDVTVEGEKVDDPDEYKGDPIPGGPTDPNAPGVAGERDDDQGDDEGDDQGD